MNQLLISRLEELGLLPYLEYCNTTFMKVGSEKIPILSFDNKIQSKNKLLISAGSDGDEMDGIVAAFRLIKRFSFDKTKTNVVILPILNPSAFLNTTDYSPEDMKYLKYYYPGNDKGTFTPKLMSQISKSFIKGSSVWIDLHGGNRLEQIVPYLWGYQTDSIDQNIWTKSILSSLENDRCVYDGNHNWEKVDNLSKDGTIYFISESGNGTKTSSKAQNIHISRVGKAMDFLNGKIKISIKMPESKIDLINVARRKHWIPAVGAGDVVEKGDVIGHESNFFGYRKRKAKRKIQILWMRKESKLETGQTVCGGLVI